MHCPQRTAPRCTPTAAPQHCSTAALQHWIQSLSAYSPHHRLLFRHRRGDRAADDASRLDGVRDGAATRNPRVARAGRRAAARARRDQRGIDARGGRDRGTRAGPDRRAREQRRVQPVRSGRGSAGRARSQAVRDQRLRPAASDPARFSRHAPRQGRPHRQHRIDGGPPDISGRRHLPCVEACAGRAQRRAPLRSAGIRHRRDPDRAGPDQSRASRTSPSRASIASSIAAARTRTSPARSAVSRARATKRGRSGG